MLKFLLKVFSLNVEVTHVQKGLLFLICLSIFSLTDWGEVQSGGEIKKECPAKTE